MAFIRLKKIAGHQYAVLVENTWTSKGPRQSSKRYLGRYREFPATQIQPPAVPDVAAHVRAELLACGFSDKLALDKIKVNLQNCTVRDGRKRIVLGINGGYLCDFTLRKLLHFVPLEEVTPGYGLARAFSDAGVRVARDQFVRIYQKIYTRKTPSAQAQTI